MQLTNTITVALATAFSAAALPRHIVRDIYDSPGCGFVSGPSPSKLFNLKPDLPCSWFNEPDKHESTLTYENGTVFKGPYTYDYVKIHDMDKCKGCKFYKNKDCTDAEPFVPQWRDSTNATTGEKEPGWKIGDIEKDVIMYAKCD